MGLSILELPMTSTDVDSNVNALLHSDSSVMRDRQLQFPEFTVAISMGRLLTIYTTIQRERNCFELKHPIRNPVRDVMYCLRIVLNKYHPRSVSYWRMKNGVHECMLVQMFKSILSFDRACVSGKCGSAWLIEKLHSESGNSNMHYVSTSQCSHNTNSANSIVRNLRPTCQRSVLWIINHVWSLQTILADVWDIALRR